MYETYETSRHSGRPIDIYLFTYGPEASHYYAYTSHVDDVEIDGIIYLAIPISRDNTKSSGSLDKAVYRVKLARDVEILDLFRVYPPSQMVTLTIRSGHLPDPDVEFLTVWAGRVLGYERQDSEAILSCEPVSTTMKRVGLRRHYQIRCPHLLYGPDCRANQAARTVAATVSIVDGLNITLVGGWTALALEKYRQGRVQWTGADGQVEIRQVLGTFEPNTLRMDALLRGLQAGMTVSVSAGCNHLTSAPGGGGDCVDLHNNGPNFGGCKWIPTKNPIGSFNRFY